MKILIGSSIFIIGTFIDRNIIGVGNYSFLLGYTTAVICSIYHDFKKPLDTKTKSDNV